MIIIACLIVIAIGLLAAQVELWCDLSGGSYGRTTRRKGGYFDADIHR